MSPALRLTPWPVDTDHSAPVSRMVVIHNINPQDQVLWDFGTEQDRILPETMSDKHDICTGHGGCHIKERMEENVPNMQ